MLRLATSSLRHQFPGAITRLSVNLDNIGSRFYTLSASSTQTDKLQSPSIQRLATYSRHLSSTAKIMASDRPSTPPPQFETTPLPSRKEGDDTYVATAACLIIGDEVLNGKTRDSNSNFMARLLFDLGIEMKRVEVIADEEDEIIEAVRRMTEKYDLVVTSGGIGPTHDDITYSSIAKAFDDEGRLAYHDETLRRMWEMGKKRYALQQQTEEQALARKRMALFPVKDAEVLHVDKTLWVPVVRMKGRLCILPGVPRLFEQLITSYMANYVTLPPSSSKPFRVLVHTAMPESNIAPFLTSLQARVKAEGIRVGSYPKIMHGVDVSLIGKDQERLAELAEECCKELKGEVIAQGKLGQEDKA